MSKKKEQEEGKRQQPSTRFASLNESKEIKNVE